MLRGLSCPLAEIAAFPLLEKDEELLEVPRAAGTNVSHLLPSFVLSTVQCHSLGRSFNLPIEMGIPVVVYENTVTEVS